jgi:hypothetical protein
MPRTIPRANSSCSEQDDKSLWRRFVQCKVILGSWIAIQRGHAKTVELEACQPIADAIQADLKIGEARDLAREDIRLTDNELLRLVNEKARGFLARDPTNGIVDIDRWQSDARWALQQWQSGAFDGHRGEYVAVYLDEARGFGTDPNELRRRYSKEFDVPFQRIIVKYIDEED